MALLTRLKEGPGNTGPSPELENSRLVLMVAGEASADLHGSNLVKAMKRLDPDIVFWGIGGEKMDRAGVRILISASHMAVVGMTEVLNKLPVIARASRKLKSILKKNRPDLLILLDYPGFNIHIARTAKRFQVPVLYYISPQVWAWRSGRVKKMSRRIDRMAVILPFEEEFYSRRGMRVDYVGHPLMDASGIGKQKEKCGKIHSYPFTSDFRYPVIGLLPGSRNEEIKNLFPDMLRSVEIMKRRYPEMHCLLPLAPTIEPEFIQSFIENPAAGIDIIRGDIQRVLSLCDVVLVASGTATLDAAIAEVPMVIVYRVSRVSYWIGKRVIKVPYIGLVNLVAGEKVVPELIQQEVTPQRIASEALAILENADIREQMKKNLGLVKERLGGRGASGKTAEIALEMM